MNQSSYSPAATALHLHPPSLLRRDYSELNNESGLAPLRHHSAAQNNTAGRVEAGGPKQIHARSTHPQVGVSERGDRQRLVPSFAPLRIAPHPINQPTYHPTTYRDARRPQPLPPPPSAPQPQHCLHSAAEPSTAVSSRSAGCRRATSLPAGGSHSHSLLVFLLHRSHRSLHRPLAVPRAAHVRLPPAATNDGREQQHSTDNSSSTSAAASSSSYRE